MLTVFYFNVHVCAWLVHLVGFNGCCVRLNILLSALVLIEPSRLKGPIKYYVSLFPRNVTLH